MTGCLVSLRYSAVDTGRLEPRLCHQEGRRPSVSRTPAEARPRTCASSQSPGRRRALQRPEEPPATQIAFFLSRLGNRSVNPGTGFRLTHSFLHFALVSLRLFRSPCRLRWGEWNEESPPGLSPHAVAVRLARPAGRGRPRPRAGACHASLVQGARARRGDPRPLRSGPASLGLQCHFFQIRRRRAFV